MFLKTGILTEHSFLNISALGLLAQSVRLLSFHSDFTIHEIVISIVHQPSVLFQPWLETLLELEGVTSVVDCVKCVPIPVKRKTKKNRMTHPHRQLKIE